MLYFANSAGVMVKPNRVSEFIFYGGFKSILQLIPMFRREDQLFLSFQLLYQLLKKNPQNQKLAFKQDLFKVLIGNIEDITFLLEEKALAATNLIINEITDKD